MKLKPATAKGTYMRSITISTTHGPGVKVDPTPFTALARSSVSSQHDLAYRPPSKKQATSRPSKRADSPAETSGTPAARRRDAPRFDRRGVRCFRGEHHGQSTKRASPRRDQGGVRRTSPRSSSPTTAASPSRSSPRCAMTSARPAATTASSRTRSSRSRSRARKMEPLTAAHDRHRPPSSGRPSELRSRRPRSRSSGPRTSPSSRSRAATTRARSSTPTGVETLVEDAGQERDPRLDAHDVPRGAAELRRADRGARSELRVPPRRAQAPARERS